MKLLALDSSISKAQICLYNDGNITRKVLDDSQTHSEFLLKEIDNLLTQNNIGINEIEYLSVNVGPGSFTGIRIGISFVKAFMCALNQKTTIVNNFDLINFNILKKEQEYYIILPSNNEDLYFCHYKENEIKYGYKSCGELNKICVDNSINVYCNKSDSESFLEIKNLIPIEIDEDSFINLSIENIKKQKLYSINEISPLYIKKSQAENELLKKISNNLSIDDKVEIKDLVTLEKKCFDNPYSETLLKNDLLNEKRKSFFAYYNDEPIGYINFEVILDEIELYRICVLEEFRQYGIGTKLMNKMVEYFNENNCKKIFLEVDKENFGAIKLYENFGFKKVAERKNYYQNNHDALVFTLEKK